MSADIRTSGNYVCRYHTKVETKPSREQWEPAQGERLRTEGVEGVCGEQFFCKCITFWGKNDFMYHNTITMSVYQ